MIDSQIYSQLDSPNYRFKILKYLYYIHGCFPEMKSSLIDSLNSSVNTNILRHGLLVCTFWISWNITQGHSGSSNFQAINHSFEIKVIFRENSQDAV